MIEKIYDLHFTMYQFKKIYKNMSNRIMFSKLKALLTIIEEEYKLHHC